MNRSNVLKTVILYSMYDSGEDDFETTKQEPKRKKIKKEKTEEKEESDNDNIQ